MTAFFPRPSSCRADNRAGRSKIRLWRGAEVYGWVRRGLWPAPWTGQFALCAGVRALHFQKNPGPRLFCQPNSFVFVLWNIPGHDIGHDFSYFGSCYYNSPSRFLTTIGRSFFHMENNFVSSQSHPQMWWSCCWPTVVCDVMCIMVIVLIVRCLSHSCFWKVPLFYLVLKTIGFWSQSDQVCPFWPLPLKNAQWKLSPCNLLVVHHHLSQEGRPVRSTKVPMKYLQSTLPRLSGIVREK